MMEITNHDQEEGDILIIKDSFSNMLMPYMSLTLRHIEAWDMRLGKNIYDYLEEHPQTQTVMIAYNLSFMPTSEMYDFQRGESGGD